MDPVTLGLYIDLGVTAFTQGTKMYLMFKELLKAHGLTDEEINDIELKIIAEAEKRKAEREQMGKSSTDE